VAIGKNYVEHVREMGGDAAPETPLIFLKPSTSVIGDGDAIRIPPSSSEVHYEGELAAIIGRPARNVAPEEALSYVLGYAAGNDVTARDQQRANGEIVQDGRTGHMIHDIATQIAFMSGVMTLLPGDVILTGTPSGVGPIKDGDSVSVEIEGIGTLTNPVVKAT
jgi:2-keto-4-pentenoate hydratase/2-oxohepta-3-ene-1,7-dioic acid hydratase in catechol pathway